MTTSRRVLCVRREDELLYNPRDISSGEMTLWVDKAESENSPAYRQVIPYCVVTDCRGLILTYRRNGSEGRLKDLFSIGVGGHVEEGETFIDCMKRELQEEIGLSDGEYSFTWTDKIIVNSDSQVSHAHLGVVVLVRLTGSHGVKESEEINEPRHLQVDDLMGTELFLSLEGWSQCVVTWLRSYQLEINKDVTE